MTVVLACLAALAGYFVWQLGRFDRKLPRREAQVRALADTAALALIIAGAWLGGAVAPHWGPYRIAGAPGAIIGVVLAALVAGPARRWVLIRLGIDARGAM